jgi:hypothetical protein
MQKLLLPLMLIIFFVACKPSKEEEPKDAEESQTVFFSRGERPVEFYSLARIDFIEVVADVDTNFDGESDVVKFFGKSTNVKVGDLINVDKFENFRYEQIVGEVLELNAHVKTSVFTLGSINNKETWLPNGALEMTIRYHNQKIGETIDPACGNQIQNASFSVAMQQ